MHTEYEPNMETNIHKCTYGAPVNNSHVYIAVSILLCYATQWTKHTPESFLCKVNSMETLSKLGPQPQARVPKLVRALGAGLVPAPISGPGAGAL